MKISYDVTRGYRNEARRLLRGTIVFNNWLTEILYVRASWSRGLDIELFIQQTDREPVKGKLITPEMILIAISALVQDGLCQRKKVGKSHFLVRAPGIDYGFAKKYD